MYQGINDKYLRDHHIQAKWFYGFADDQMFRKRLSVTVKALQAIKKLKNARVALIGGFAPGFYDLYFDERSVFSKLNGIYINRLHEYDEVIKLAEKVTDQDVKPYLAELDALGIKATPVAANLRDLSIRIYLAYRRLTEEYGYDAIAVSCWPKFQDDYKYSVCSVLGMLNDDKLVAACEGDLMSAISMLALQEMSGESTTLMDFSAFDEEDESVLFCTAVLHPKRIAVRMDTRWAKIIAECLMNLGRSTVAASCGIWSSMRVKQRYSVSAEIWKVILILRGNL